MTSGSPVFILSLQKRNSSVHDATVVKKLNWIVRVLATNLAVTFALAIALVIRLQPNLERAAQATERVEARLQSFAYEVQPVATEGAGKMIETIKRKVAERLSETATDESRRLVRCSCRKKPTASLKRDDADDQ